MSVSAELFGSMLIRLLSSNVDGVASLRVYSVGQRVAAKSVYCLSGRSVTPESGINLPCFHTSAIVNHRAVIYCWHLLAK